VTPRQYKEYAKAEEAERKERLQREAESWHLPLERGEESFHRALEAMKGWGLYQEDIPLIIKLTENPNYRTARHLGGAVDLFTHDCVHILLSRGILLKDEAFVIGFTMGSSKKMKRWRRNLFMFISKHLYPEGYKFGEEERFVFNAGVALGSQCPTDLTEVDFSKLLDYKIKGVREKLGLDIELLRCYNCIEKKIFPNSPESQRLYNENSAPSALPEHPRRHE